MNKILVGIFLFLLVVVGGELLFYFFLSPPKQTAVTNSAALPKTSVSPTATALHIDTAQPIANQLFAFVADDLVKNQAELARDGILKSYLVTVTYRAKIFEVSATPRTVTLPVGGTTYTSAASLVIQKKSGESYGFRLDENDLAKIKLTQYDERTQETSVINFSDLKPGDDIDFTLTQNLLRDPKNNLVNAAIIRYISSLPSPTENKPPL